MSTEKKAATPGTWDEADIGSGEKSQGQRDTDKMLEDIPTLPDDDTADEDGIPDEDAEDYADDVAPGDELDDINMELERSLEKDEPSSQLDDLDPVPPRG